MRNLAIEVRRALRSLARRPGFTALVAVTLAVGIGANVGIAGYLSYFIRPTVEAPDLGRVHWLFDATPEEPYGQLSYLDWRDVAAADTGLVEHAAYRIFAASVVAPGQTLHAWGFAVSGEYFRLFGTRPQAGRLLQPADDRPGAEPVVVLADAYWRKHFDADPAVVGTTVALDGEHRYTVVGIGPRGFQGHGYTLSLFVPLATVEPLLTQPFGHEGSPVNALARLAPGAGREPAEAALAAIAAGLDRSHPRTGPRAGPEPGSAGQPRCFRLEPAAEWNGFPQDDPVARGARLLMGTVAFLLVLACANVANLMLARAVGRERELAVHAAVGAGRGRLGVQLLAEGLALALLGGVLGLPLAYGLHALVESYLLASNPVGMGEWGEGSSLIVDPAMTVSVFGAAVVGGGLLVAFAPLFRMRRFELAAALRSGTRASGGLRGPLGLLVVFQVALAVVLLFGAGLLARNLWLALGRDPGFEIDGLAVAALYLPFERRGPGGGPIDEGPVKERYQELLDRARELPEVGAAALASRIPLSPLARQVRAAPPDGAGAPAEPVALDFDVVSEGYFETLGVPLLQGRAFGPGDRAGAPPVVVLNRTAAERLFPGGGAVGESLALVELGPGGGGAPPESWQVVGVVGDHHSRGLTAEIEPMVYFSFHQKLQRRLALFARTGGPIQAPLRRMLRERFPEVAVVDLVPFSDQVRRTLVDQRMLRDLGAGFGLAGLGLAALGVFALLSYAVSRRTRELGIRQAVGATPAAVRRLVLAESGRLVVWGIALGTAAAWTLARWLEGFLYGLEARDPATWLAVAATVVAAALVAALLPAVRASRVSPLEALRQE